MKHQTRTASAFVLMLLLAFPLVASALPAPIEANQQLLVGAGVCEASWRTQGVDPETQHVALEDGVQLWLVPCASWAVNIDTVAYLEIAEPSQPNGEIVRALNFVDYDPAQGVFASSVLHNAKFSQDQKTLQSRQYFQTGQICGSAGQFHYNSGQQRFLLDHLLKNDDCKDPNGSWETVLGH